MGKQVYSFHEGNQDMRELLGSKGANLAEMTRLGLPIPAGFTITTEACMAYLTNHKKWDAELQAEIDQHIEQLENETGKSFNSPHHLLLVSVRSGAKQSMPGMMDTILNLGLNDKTVESLATETNNPTFAYDCYRRLIQMYGNVVNGIPSYLFEDELSQVKKQQGIQNDTDMKASDWQLVIAIYKDLYHQQTERDFPQNPKEQLYGAIEAVFSSWNNERAKVYRQLNNIPNDLGTAVNIQEMVYGNSGNQSGTGVVFTRHPATGKPGIFGEYLINAQGEDVVAGIRTPKPVSDLAQAMPEIYQQFVSLAEKLEKHYKDMQDIEFTIENEKLFFLQTRNGKRTAKAAFQIAVDLVEEGIISKEEAVMQIEPKSVDKLLHPSFDQEAIDSAEILTNVGLPASPGAASGRIYFDAEMAKERAEAGEKVILFRQETSPEDINGMVVSEAIVTSRGGMTSHAAVVARGLGCCCVVGCQELDIDEKNKQVTIFDEVLIEGDEVSVDGTKGVIYRGKIPTVPSTSDDAFQKLMAWAKEISRLDVRMNAETINDIRMGLNFNPDGIGLVRTEHMFFAPERLREMRRFILSQHAYDQKAALDKILRYQIEDFKVIYQEMQSHPVVIRLLDPPFHEFLPAGNRDMQMVANQMNLTINQLQARIEELTEVNPMLGHRGCRLAISYPDLYKMQVEAIIRAAIKMKQSGVRVKPEIMIPLVGMKEELTRIKEDIIAHIENILIENKTYIAYSVGTMLEVPRACFIADELSEQADFFSFGTNDLTQMVYGFSRDDAGKFINHYLSQNILPFDPFQTIDRDGVGELVKIAVKKARQTNPNIKIGVCGELGGDPDSIAFFTEVGLDYVSCSPFRVPVAQLAAAQSTIQQTT